jgi:hypothetical protein
MLLTAPKEDGNRLAQRVQSFLEASLIPAEGCLEVQDDAALQRVSRSFLQQGDRPLEGLLRSVKI